MVHICPNEQCPHKMRTGRAAEFMERARACSDCGSGLVAVEYEEIGACEIELHRKSALKPGNLIRPALVSIMALIAYIVLGYVPVPVWRSGGVIFGGGFSFLSLSSGSMNMSDITISIISLGIQPFVVAYVLVEIGALFVPVLKAWRRSGHSGRAKLLRLALIVAAVIGALYGWMILFKLSQIDGAGMGQLEMLEYLLPLACMLAGTYIILLLARAVTRHGIGNGISLFICFGIARVLYDNTAEIIRYQREISEHIDKRAFIIFAITAIVVVLVERFAIRMPVKFKGTDGGYLPLKLTAAGIIPVSLSTSMAGALFSLPGFMGQSSWWLNNSYLIYSAGIGICILFSYIFAKAFHSYGEMSRRLIGAGAEVAPDMEGRIRRKVSLIVIPCSTLYLIAIFLLSRHIYSIGNEVKLLLSGSLTVMMLVILMDIWSEAKLRMMSEPVSIYETHDADEAGIMMSMLEAHGVPCRMKGYYHRAILYFFGPHIEISVMVPEGRADEAREIIREFVEQPRQTL